MRFLIDGIGVAGSLSPLISLLAMFHIEIGISFSLIAGMRETGQDWSCFLLCAIFFDLDVFHDVQVCRRAHAVSLSLAGRAFCLFLLFVASSPK